MAQVGRISGQVLFSNLLRDGTDIWFRNDNNTPELLYVDVNNGRIGVNTSTPTHELQTSGTTRTTNLIVDEDLTTPRFGFSNNDININFGDINISSTDTIIASGLETTHFKIEDNRITAIVDDSSIDLVPNGTGETNIDGNLNVFGNLDATGNITFTGSMEFGSDDIDSITFEADVNSNIVPNSNTRWSLGSANKRWNNFFTNFINGREVDADAVTAGGINFSFQEGTIIYVSQGGTNTNTGLSILSPLASIKEAISRTQATAENPTVILITSGTYEEETPLVVPEYVSIVGLDMRNTVVFPTSYTTSEDVFLLNNASAVSNLTIKDFFYDSVNNTGHAFRFAPGANIVTRSPYIQNVTVITQSTGGPVSDAGKGALVDGAEINLDSLYWGMLFHAVTFITPGTDALSLTNLARVEWLNCFTYFARRGIYAFTSPNGITGTAFTAELPGGSSSIVTPTVTYDGGNSLTEETNILDGGDASTYLLRGTNTELRSIGSANVYGEYGVVADGPSNLLYLINHNFSYIGSQNDSSNDQSLVVRENEIEAINSARIYYTSTDEQGTFRVGENFFVNFEDNTSSINISSLNLETLTQIAVTSGFNRTVITGSDINLGNLRIVDNEIYSTTGDLIIDSPLDINLLDNVSMKQNLTVSGNTSIGGTILQFGNEAVDTISFSMGFDQTLEPKQNNIFDLGTDEKNWDNAYLSQVELQDILMFDNIITTKTSNSDLELRASLELIPAGDVIFDTNGAHTWTVPEGVTEISIVAVGAGGRADTASGYSGGGGGLRYYNSLPVTPGQTYDIYVPRPSSTGEVLPDTTFSLGGTEILRAGSGTLRFGGTGTAIGGNIGGGNGGAGGSGGNTFFNVAGGGGGAGGYSGNGGNGAAPAGNGGNGSGGGGGGGASGSGWASGLGGGVGLFGEGASGTGGIYGNGTTNGNPGSNGVGKNYGGGGNAGTTSRKVPGGGALRIIWGENRSFPSTNVEAGAGGSIPAATKILFSNDTTFNQNLTVGENTVLASAVVSGNIIHSGNYTISDALVSTTDLNTSTANIAGDAIINDITITGNLLETTVTNLDLELRANGTGQVVFNDNVNVTNQINVIGDAFLDNTSIQDDVESTQLIGSNIVLEQNIITTTESNSDLELRATNSNEILIQNNNVRIDNNLTVNGTGTLNDGVVTSTFSGGEAAVQKDFFGDALLLTAEPSSATWLAIQTLEPGDSGIITISNVDYPFTLVSWPVGVPREEAVIDIPTLSNGVATFDITITIRPRFPIELDDTVITGTLTQTGNRTQTGNYNLLGALSPGLLEALSAIQFENYRISGNTIQTTESNSNLELQAERNVIFDDNVNLTQSLQVLGNTTFNNVIIQNSISTEFFDTPDIDFLDNRITTTLSNSNLELRASDIVVTSIVLSVFGGNGGASPAHNTYGCAGGGAGGYSGNGGRGGTGGTNLGTAGTGGAGGGGYVGNNSLGPGAGGGVGLLGEGASGGSGGFSNPGGQGGSGGTRGGAGIISVGGLFGGGGSGDSTLSGGTAYTGGGGGGLRYVNNIPVTPGDTYTLTIGAGGTAAANVGQGGDGGMRIIWGEGRAYPSTNTADVGDQQVVYDTPGVYEWTVPEGVTSICVVCVGGGGSGWEGTDGGNTSFDTIFFAEGGKTPLTSQGVGSGGGGSSEAIINVGGPTGDSNKVSIPSNDVQISNNLAIAGTTTLSGLSITGLLTHTGNTVQVGDYNQTGNLVVDGDIEIDSSVTFEKYFISGNLITNTVNNDNIILQASGTGNVVIDNLNVNQDVTVLGFATNAIDLGSNLLNPNFETTDIAIYQNVIETTNLNSDLILEASGTGQIYLSNNDLQIDNSLTVNGATTFNNDVDISGTLSQTGSTLSTGNYNLTGNLDTEFLVINSQLQINDIVFNDNVISLETANTDLELRASGTGNIVLQEQLNVSNDLTANNVTVNNIIITGTADINNMFVPIDIEIFDNVITTLTSNSNLELRADGNGSVYLQDVQVNTNTISTPIDTTISADTVNITSTGALGLPASSTVLTRNQGDIRYDSDSNLFEAYGTNQARITLTDLYSSDRLTNVQFNNDTIEFRLGNTLTTTISSTELSTNSLIVDDVFLNNNKITTINSNADVQIKATGTGTVNFENFAFSNNNTITYSGGNLEFNSTGTGYLKFSGTAGVVIPAGGDQTRESNPEIGHTRYNTELGYLEVFDGSSWVSGVGGQDTTVTEEYMLDLLDLYTLIFA